VIVEYVLLITAFVVMLLKITYFAPLNAFNEAGPRLGARVEKHLTTGRGFSELSHRKADWKKKP
jgi:hypothetical protein